MHQDAATVRASKDLMDIPGLQRTCAAEATAFPCQLPSSKKGASERRIESQHLLVDTLAGMAPESLHLAEHVVKFPHILYCSIYASSQRPMQTWKARLAWAP